MHDDPDGDRIRQIQQEKKEKAQIMREYGADEETITADIWSRPDAECQGTCGDYLTWEEQNSGLDMCMDCKLDSMD
jgi:hypothetical protein